MGKTEKEKLIDEFIKKLSEIEDSNDFDNPWKDPDKCENLKKFLLRSGIEYILIGEAPGRKGCLKCGVPFCDDSTLKEIIDESKVIGKESKETSAQRIYMAFKEDFVAWNVFPFHPKSENGKNRTPNSGELEFGQEYLKSFLGIFKSSSAKIILVGKKAQETFKKLNFEEPHIDISHPSTLADRCRVKEGYASGDKGWVDYIRKEVYKN